MADNFAQNIFVYYLITAIRYLFRDYRYIIVGNILIYPKGNFGSRVAPDVMVIKKTDYDPLKIRKLGSWEIDPPAFPAPNLAFEISSKSTWEVDVEYRFKPTDYAEMGIKEYFAFDPEGVWKNFNTRLKGWRSENRRAIEITANEQGWLWSEQLSCWVGVEGEDLFLYRLNGEKIVTPQEYLDELESQLEDVRIALIEAEEQSLAAENQRLEAEQRAEAEHLARTEAEQRAEAERQARTEAEERAEAERQTRLELERKVAELQAKLNQKGQI